MSGPLLCPHCQRVVLAYRNPIPTVDIIIEVDQQGIVLIKRKNPPLGWALPGGYVDYGESLEAAAIREAEEETGLTVELLGQFQAYSAPDRDPRGHTITMVFLARASGRPQGRDDALQAEIFPHEFWPSQLAFDHARILADYLEYKKSGRRSIGLP